MPHSSVSFKIHQCFQCFIIIFGLKPKITQPNDVICHIYVQVPNDFSVFYACKKCRTCPWRLWEHIFELHGEFLFLKYWLFYLGNNIECPVDTICTMNTQVRAKDFWVRANCFIHQEAITRVTWALCFQYTLITMPGALV